MNPTSKVNPRAVSRRPARSACAAPRAVSSTSVHPREVFRFSVATGAAAIIVAHNHPSGDPSPSAEDRRITERLRECGEMLGIEVLDHVVVAGSEFYSFADGRVCRIREVA